MDVIDLKTGEVLATHRTTEPPLVRHAEAIGTDRFDEGEFWRHDHLAVAVDQTGLAIHIDLREAVLVVVNDAILWLDDLASVFIDKTVEAADADSGPAIGKLADPIVARRHRDAAVATDRPAKTARKHAHRQREAHRFGRPGRAIQQLTVEGKLILQDNLACWRQIQLPILRVRATHK